VKARILNAIIALCAFFVYTFFSAGSLARGESSASELVLSERTEVPAGAEIRGKQSPGENTEAETTAEILWADDPETAEYASFPDYVDENALAETFIASQLPRKGRMFRVSRPSGPSQLEEDSPARKLYDELRVMIMAVANGEEASTSLEMKAEDLLPQTSFTAGELEVETLFDENGKVTAEASAAYRDFFKTTVDLPRVVSCLMVDFPYEMYWFRKSYGTSFTYYKPGENTETLRIAKAIVTLYVSQDYADLTDWNGTGSPSRFNTEIYNSDRMSTARSRIETIISSAAGEDDYGKICFYSQEIRSLASYNGEAANANNQIPYGDPWQLIWVFDGDPDTKVVCEGYAKAFNYLCDLGTAQAESILCQGYLFSGNSNGTKSYIGAHMWNTVSMEGHNYLVDLTNHSATRNLLLVGYTEGSLQDGYWTGSGLVYSYSRVLTPRSDAELTLSPFSYQEWKEATTSAPLVTFSSLRTYPGHDVAVLVETGIPADSFQLLRNGMAEPVEVSEGIALVGAEENTEIGFAAVIDGITTPATETKLITVSQKPEGMELVLPAGAEIGDEAFAGIAARTVRLQNNTVLPGAFTDCLMLECAEVEGDTSIAGGAFDDSILLVVGEIGNWFASDYDFVLSGTGAE